MGFLKNLNGMLGNASEVTANDVKEVEVLLSNDEYVEKAYKLIRDLFIFTNKRLILIDKQGVTGKRIEYLSIPYKNINHFSVQSAGVLDLNSELFIFLSGNPNPIVKTFNANLNVFDIQAILAHYVLR